MRLMGSLKSSHLQARGERRKGCGVKCLFRRFEGNAAESYPAKGTPYTRDLSTQNTEDGPHINSGRNREERGWAIRTWHTQQSFSQCLIAENHTHAMFSQHKENKSLCIIGRLQKRISESDRELYRMLC